LGGSYTFLIIRLIVYVKVTEKNLSMKNLYEFNSKDNKVINKNQKK